MRIDLTTPEGERVVIALNGAVAAEVCVGQVRARDDLEREVGQARAALATVRGILPRLCVAADECDRLTGDGMAPEAKRLAWSRGLRDGLAGKRAPHPHGPTVPSTAPEQSSPYRGGYEYGETLRRVAGLTAEDAPLDLFSAAPAASQSAPEVG